MAAMTQNTIVAQIGVWCVAGGFIQTPTRNVARGSCSTVVLLEHVRLCLKHVGATCSVCSPPPCGEGLGVGAARFLAGSAIPPPHPSPASEGGSRPSMLLVIPRR